MLLFAKIQDFRMNMPKYAFGEHLKLRENKKLSIFILSKHFIDNINLENNRFYYFE
jgi:hypothetical protein